MASNPPAIVASKAVNTSGQSSPAQSQAASSATGDSYGQRRTGGSGAFGAGNASRSNPSPRNSQASRKQHKSSKRFRVDEDAVAEAAAMRSTNSRKGQTSITHLMNITLPPRQQNHYNYSHGYGRARKGPSWGLGSGYHAVDKARYVHANYRFIVNPTGDYNPQSVDADLHLDWNSVLQILVSAQSQAASCPICLGTPTAPRMAKCGHIFCLPCLIRFMHSEDESSQNHTPLKRPRWKKCPLCFDSIYISETRPVRLYEGQEGEPPREGGDVVLRLVMRQSGKTLALPRDGADSLAKNEDIPWHFAAEVMDYARIMKGSEDYIMDQLNKDIEAIELQEKEDELMFGEDNVEWSRKAVRSIHEAKEKLEGIGNPPSTAPKPSEPKAKRQPIQFKAAEDAPDMYNISHASSSGHLPASSAPSTSSPPDTSFEVEATSQGKQSHEPVSALASSISEYNRSRANPTAYQPSEYYFYQALLHYYLSPLDIRILREAFGDYSSFPATILPRVERVSTGHIIDDDFRRRTKYLSHLPYGCEVGFLECDWTDTVSPEILEKFKPEIERRRKRNSDKEAQDEKARRNAEAEEEKRYAFARRKRGTGTSSHILGGGGPSSERFSAADFVPLVSHDAADSSSADANLDSTSPPTSWNVRHGQGSAFASLASPGTSPEQPRTVWGTAIVAPLHESPTLSAAQRTEDHDDGWLQGWENELQAENEDLIRRAQDMSLEETIGESSRSASAGGQQGGGGSGGGGGKKKKGKKITLMSTNVRRGA
ncbi:hypothetical protein K402DRAFT_456252 [Aulographum hederae CBS 113979]|uniref:RING-type domain-containing protein n=1 Tax=Aulographum hederae CBS 113979 TaxID=1176131 RepID=A0A6G1GSM9_9PEZI|nr:hypothetical protein K402DRAFT_456252 [Aulographum hederae CBS 113979]